MAGRKVRVTVMRKRDLGGKVGEIAITLQSEDYVELDSVTAACIPLIDQAEATLQGWIEAKGLAAANNTGDTRLHPAERIVIEMKDGKKYYKVKGGQFSEHGINFWPEHMKQNGIDPRNIPDDGHVCKPGTQMEVEYIMGNPKRVIRLIADQNG